MVAVDRQVDGLEGLAVPILSEIYQDDIACISRAMYRWTCRATYFLVVVQQEGLHGGTPKRSANNRIDVVGDSGVVVFYFHNYLYPILSQKRNVASRLGFGVQLHAFAGMHLEWPLGNSCGLVFVDIFWFYTLARGEIRRVWLSITNEVLRCLGSRSNKQHTHPHQHGAAEDVFIASPRYLWCAIQLVYPVSSCYVANDLVQHGSVLGDAGRD